MHDASKLERAFARFDAVNAQDPNREEYEGEIQGKELVWAKRITRWLERLEPDASEPLRLAARCQHIRRWEIPRDRYPKTRAGYRRWRSDLAKFHARIAGEILREVGYDDETIRRVESLVRKENLASDPEAQLLEDVICIVFLEDYFDRFAEEHDEGKLVNILRKTWRKMSPRGHEIAKRLDLSERAKTLLARALER